MDTKGNSDQNKTHIEQGKQITLFTSFNGIKLGNKSLFICNLSI